ncbi:hypothetical protein C8039_03905 [Halogeometricum sp. wsp3]|nr:hypothetical protein C8039_03905 [Halogeometricum sp. wsp3]
MTKVVGHLPRATLVAGQCAACESLAFPRGCVFVLGIRSIATMSLWLTVRHSEFLLKLFQTIGAPRYRHHENAA